MTKRDCYLHNHRVRRGHQLKILCTKALVSSQRQRMALPSGAAMKQHSLKRLAPSQAPATVASIRLAIAEGRKLPMDDLCRSLVCGLEVEYGDS